MNDPNLNILPSSSPLKILTGYISSQKKRLIGQSKEMKTTWIESRRFDLYLAVQLLVAMDKFLILEGRLCTRLCIP